MFQGNVLASFQEAIKSIYAFRNVQVQLTPDERPFPFSGQQIVTLFLSEFTRTDLKDTRRYDLSTTICITQRTPVAPHNKVSELLYSRNTYSLSVLSELILTLIDSNNNILDSIRLGVSSSVNQIINNFEDSSREGEYPTSIELDILQQILESEVITPIRAVAISSIPIPRFAEFFTAYDQKNDYPDPTGQGRIVEAGYSMLVSVRGPSFILPVRC